MLLAVHKGLEPVEHLESLVPSVPPKKRESATQLSNFPESRKD